MNLSRYVIKMNIIILVIFAINDTFPDILIKKYKISRLLAIASVIKKIEKLSASVINKHDVVSDLNLCHTLSRLKNLKKQSQDFVLRAMNKAASSG